MSEHDIADCPKCKQRDYILKDDDVWVCLNCGHTSKMPKSRFDSQDNPSIFSTFIAVSLIAVVLMVVLGNGRLAIAPSQDTIQEPQQQNFK
jgi:uncharacterized protein (DUF983 family)